MKAVLVFCPFSDPTCIPLGLAQLKSFVKKQAQGSNILNLDLNIDFINTMGNKNFWETHKSIFASSELAYSNEYNRLKYVFNNREFYLLYQKAILRLKNRKHDNFNDLNLYRANFNTVTLLYRHWHSCLAQIIKANLERDIPVPKTLENLLEKDIVKIKKHKPDIVGFSLLSEMQLAYSLILAKALKNKFKLPIIFGGAYIPHLDYSGMLKMFDFIDFIIPGEGEIGFTELLKNYRAKRFKDVPGLVYRKANTIYNNQPTLIRNLDDLAFPDFSDFNLRKYLFPTTVLPIYFSKGCFWQKCAFCTYFKNYPFPYKTKSITRFIEELKYFRKLGIRHFLFNDDVISASDLNLISQAIIRENLDLYFSSMVRPEKGFNGNILKNLHKAGMRLLLWGVESHSQRMLDSMHKGTQLKKIDSLLKESRRIGLHNHVFMIQGLPNQTEKEIIKDMRFLRKNIRDVSFWIHEFSLMQDSVLFKHHENFGIHGLKRIPIYVKGENILFSEEVNFKRKKELDWGLINKIKSDIFDELYKKCETFGYESYTPAHTLIHASANNARVNC